MCVWCIPVLTVAHGLSRNMPFSMPCQGHPVSFIAGKIKEVSDILPWVLLTYLLIQHLFIIYKITKQLDMGGTEDSQLQVFRAL